jgi:hypothetical protein
MAITKLEQDTVSRSMQAARLTLDQLKPAIDSLSSLYDSAGGLKTTITQADLDGVPSFSGLTKQQLDDGMYALTTVLKPAIDNAYAALSQLATRV